MRDYSITKQKGEQWNAEAIDKYGNKYQNYFETYEKSAEWIFYIWENEVSRAFLEHASGALLANAIKECKKIDEKANRRAIL